MTPEADAPPSPAEVLDRVVGMGEPALRGARVKLQRLLDEDGVQFVRTVDGRRRDQRWRLDPVPLVVDDAEWARVEAGVQQRATLLNLVLSDVYGPRRLLTDGLLPPEVVFGHPGFLRPLDQVRLPGFHQLTITSTDLLRDVDGAWRPLSDRTQTPSGSGYAMENRAVVQRVLPDQLRESHVQRVAPYPRSLRRALRAAAPPGTTDPRIAVLSTGPGAATAFEHAHVAGLLGYPLVEGRDLVVRDGRVLLRTVGGRPEPIDVLLRRVDAWWCDPLELRPDSLLGTPGLVEAARRGAVTVVNGLGSGVLENAGLLAHLPALARALLGQDLLLEPPRTLWCGDPEQRREVLAGLGSFVVKTIARTSPTPLLDTAGMDEPSLEELRHMIEAHPHRYVGQERVTPGTEPSLTPDGHLSDRPVVLRTFTVPGEDGPVTMRGGLARVGDRSTLSITNINGAWSKDVWVLGDRAEDVDSFWLDSGPRLRADPAETSMPARAVENLLWLGRYAERAEATVRMLRAIDDRRSDGPSGLPSMDRAIEVLLRSLTRTTGTFPGFVRQVEHLEDPTAELRAVVLDQARTGTLAHDVARLLDAATAVREVLSSDAGPVLGSLELHLLGVDEDLPLLARQSASTPPYGRAPLGEVLTSLLALQGIGAESLVRDPSWRFLDLGRRFERALQLIRLLRSTLVDVHDAATDSLVLESVLVTAESVITYRRRYRSTGQVAAALELLLTDADNPRSLRWQLDRVLATLPRMPGHPGPGRLSAVEEPVTAADAALSTADLDRAAAVVAVDGGQRRPELDRLLSHLDGLLREGAATLERTAFPPTPTHRAQVDQRVGVSVDVLLA